ncbi:MAG: hypothetical protein Hyperionvirus5_40 [Hyperionvirus sp.]|uniref:Uncharacterized protein n=1 Tax=Hyperionvirus sp. TaxID=2487770 RepID=A0A3G5A9S2_9VIRU|nr:MAG: hypothetical protein Hyperionvirus5_40 [Hyperionvirus sp.]
MESILEEAKRAYKELALKILERNRENELRVIKKKEDTYVNFKKYYSEDSKTVKFLEPITFASLEERVVCLPELYVKCLDALKKFGCVIYEFHEDPSEAKYNVQNWFSSAEDTSAYTFLCRANNWFFNCYLNIHNDCPDGIFGVWKLFNCITNERFDYYCDMFGENKSIAYAENLFEMAHSPSYDDFLKTKWGFLEDLNLKLSTDFTIKESQTTIKLRPEEIYFKLEVAENALLTITYDDRKKAIILTARANKESLQYTSPADYPALLIQIKLLFQFLKNEYGYLENGVYYNDKQFNKLFEDIAASHQRDHYDCYNYYHGNLERYVPGDKYDSHRYGDDYDNGVSLRNKIYCDISFCAHFGESMLKTDPTPTPVEEKTDPPVLQMISSNGFDYETYRFNVKVHSLEPDEKTVVAEFTISQYKTQSRSEELKNKITIKGPYLEMFAHVRKYVCDIYAIYNMPITL